MGDWEGIGGEFGVYNDISHKFVPRSIPDLTLCRIWQRISARPSYARKITRLGGAYVGVLHMHWRERKEEKNICLSAASLVRVSPPPPQDTNPGEIPDVFSLADANYGQQNISARIVGEAVRRCTPLPRPHHHVNWYPDTPPISSSLINHSGGTPQKDIYPNCSARCKVHYVQGGPLSPSPPPTGSEHKLCR